MSRPGIAEAGEKEVHRDPHLTPHTVNSERPELTQGLSAAALRAFPTGRFCALKAVLGTAVRGALSLASVRCHWHTPPAVPPPDCLQVSPDVLWRPKLPS